MRKIDGLVCLLLLSATRALACSPLMPTFAELLNDRSAWQTVVLGHYVPLPEDRDRTHYSPYFVVDEVLAGHLPPPQTLRTNAHVVYRSKNRSEGVQAKLYQTWMFGPWGSVCEQYNMDSSQSPEPPKNAYVVLVQYQNQQKLQLPFGQASVQVVDGAIVTSLSPSDQPNNGYSAQAALRLLDLKSWLKTARQLEPAWVAEKPTR